MSETILHVFWDELKPELQEGCIIIDDWHFHMQFALSVNANMPVSSNVPIIKIHDINKFNALLTEYTTKIYNYINTTGWLKNSDMIYFQDKRLTIKAIMTFLLANMNFADFNEPELFIKKRITYFNNALDYQNMTNSIYGLNTKVLEFAKFTNLDLEERVSLTPLNDENFLTYNCILTNGSETYHFPKIVFGIDDNKCLISYIQKKKENRTKFHKDIERIFYKLNKGITDTNVLTTNLVALTFFFNFLRRININIVSFDPFFPGRHQLKAYKIYAKNSLSESDYFAILERQVTNNYLTFARLEELLGESVFTLLNVPMIQDLSLHAKLENNYAHHENLLTSINNLRTNKRVL